MRWTTTLALLALAACREATVDDADGDGLVGAEDCDDEDATEGSATLWYWDADDDGYGASADPVTSCELPAGYVPRGGDCNDATTTVRPGEAEACNGRDDDCDGVVDEGAPQVAYAVDADGDGFGDPFATGLGCGPGDGLVENGADCDDADGAVSPGAEELCNGVDDDCDGAVDDDATGGAAAFVDADADGFGAGDPLVVCGLPEGHSDVDGDCDDADDAVFPGAIETCDARDEDCDGAVDDDAADAPVRYEDGDGDGYGDPASAVASCEPVAGWVGNADDCDDASSTTSPDTLWYADADADGHGDASSPTASCLAPPDHVADDRDCDDADGATFPGAPETCDGEDDDCDGAADDSPVAAAAWYADADGDGYGDPAASGLACEAPAGFVAGVGDCDDTRADVSEGAVEVCGAADEDCDGAVDLDDPTLSDAVPWYPDGDGDGEGVATGAVLACDAPAGHAGVPGDCDDGDALVHGGASEVCNGGDDDCDGLVDGDDPDQVGDATWFGDADGDGWGDAAVTQLACVAEPGWASRPGDCDDGDGAVSPSAVEVCDDGVDGDCDGGPGECGIVGRLATADADTTWEATSASEAAGSAVAALGDVDGDGRGDFAVGGPTYNAGSGAVYFVPGGPVGDQELSYATVPQVTGSSVGSFGTALVAAGDLDGDGTDDLAVGAPESDIGLAESGAVFFLPVTRSTSGVILAATTGVLRGDARQDRAGLAVAGAGDVDDDGHVDLLVGAPGDDTPAPDAGAVYLVHGPLVAATRTLSTATTKLVGLTMGDAVGGAVAGGEDVDGDGLPDVLVGAEAVGSAGEGALYLVVDPPAGDLTLASAHATVPGEPGDGLGAEVALLDANVDGYADLVAGASGVPGVWIFYGPDPGDTRGGADLSLDGGTFTSAGEVLGVAGDVDADGALDLLVGAPDALAAQGIAFLMLGGRAPGTYDLERDADAVFEGDAPDDRLGSAVGSAGDVDGDGYDDVLIGASGHGASAAGAVYVFQGGGL